MAIKILRSRSPESQRRFVVEAEILSNLQHPAIVRAIAFGKTQDGQPYMALEYLAGEPLSQRLAHGALPWRDVAAIGIQVAGALHALHVAGIVHRDVKPANIMLMMEADPRSDTPPRVRTWGATAARSRRTWTTTRLLRMAQSWPKTEARSCYAPSGRNGSSGRDGVPPARLATAASPGL
ncbi:MAG: protein kinase [Vicinamibacteria bacterium]|nr:protein kinase [Vicinamibacteria bacterium]